MKKITKIFGLIINSIFHPSHLSIILRDLKGKLSVSQEPDSIHLKGAIDWLCASQDVTNGGGCAGVYTFEKGWTGPYPETTGYIISTFIKYSELVNNNGFIERARMMGDWEINIQLESGAVRGGVGVNEYPIVFNTGQVMIGWNALYRKTKEEKYLHASEKAGKWLVENMDEDGKWSKNTFNSIPHAYNIRVTWPLLELAEITQNENFKTAAIRNLNWVLEQANSNAWFNYMGFTLQEQPLTHTIAYTLRGLLECSFLVDEKLKIKILETVEKSSTYIKDSFNKINTTGPNYTRGFLPGTFNENWDLNEKYSCLTGNAQMAIIWLKLYSINGNKEFLEAAIKNIEQLKSTQILNSKNKGIRGGIAGSYPIWGSYSNFAYPNWAAKFFADALILKKEIVD